MSAFDLKVKYQEITKVVECKKRKTSDGSTVDVYELTGQPFTMLVHAITNNYMSEHNSYIKKIINNHFQTLNRD